MEKEPDDTRSYQFQTLETTAIVRARPGFWKNPKNVEMMQELIRRVYHDERTTEQDIHSRSE